MDGFFKAIDTLRDKVTAGKSITIKQACFIIWAEMCVPSTQYLAFQKWARLHKMAGRKPWPVWKAVYGGYHDAHNANQEAQASS